ncbi:MAG TPA: FmdE family protein [Nitrospiria bacterium]|nr:FmdE family protein [Nitrospiria bacterium]
MEKTFDDVVGFHGHLCLDIAMGYRIAKAAVREMGTELKNMKEVIALVENETCAVDAIQEFTGCTLGKRNLIMTATGKPVYILQNTKSQNAVRIYCHYWDTFDPDGSHSARRKAMTGPGATPEQRAEFQKELDQKIQAILTLPEEKLFRVKKVKLPPPPKVGKYKARPCPQCGESTHEGRFADFDGKKVCKTCYDVLLERKKYS